MALAQPDSHLQYRGNITDLPCRAGLPFMFLNCLSSRKYDKVVYYADVQLHLHSCVLVHRCVSWGVWHMFGSQLWRNLKELTGGFHVNLAQKHFPSNTWSKAKQLLGTSSSVQIWPQEFQWPLRSIQNSWLPLCSLLAAQSGPWSFVQEGSGKALVPSYCSQAELE